MNSRRPSKSNLPNVPKLSKLLLQRGYAEPISSLPYRILLLTIASTNMKLIPYYARDLEMDSWIRGQLTSKNRDRGNRNRDRERY